MPELPDVEVFRRYLAATSLHKEITSVEVRSTRILKEVSPDRLQERLVGRSLEGSERHGNYLFAALGGGGVLVLHFGMTGFLRYYRNAEAEPQHCRLVLHFRNGYRLAYDSQRLLGTVTLDEDRALFIRRNELGADALSVDREAFASILERGRGILKSSLMNQKLLSGIGNVYADEILFQARMHPKARVKGLNQAEVSKLYEAMRRVLEAAVGSRADPERMPQSFLLPHRGSEDRCPRCGGGVKRIKVSARSTYSRPACKRAR